MHSRCVLLDFDGGKPMQSAPGGAFQKTKVVF